MPTEQSATYEEGRRITFLKNARKTLARDQHWYYWTITKIRWKRCHYGHSKLIYKNDSAQDNNNKHIIRGNCKNLLR